MGIIDRAKNKIKERSNKTDIIEVQSEYPTEIVEYTKYDIQTINQVAETVGNFLNKTNAELQTNLAHVDAKLKKDISKIEASTMVKMQKEDNKHQRRMTDRQLISEVIEMSKNYESPDVAMRILDSIDNIVNKEKL